MRNEECGSLRRRSRIRGFLAKLKCQLEEIERRGGDRNKNWPQKSGVEVAWGWIRGIFRYILWCNTPFKVLFVTKIFFNFVVPCGVSPRQILRKCFHRPKMEI